MEKEKNLNESIISIRVKLQKAKLRKSGKNKFAGFDYFELADFLPKLNELMLEQGVNDRFTIKDNTATLTLIKGEESQEYSIPFIVFDTPTNVRYDKNGEAKEVKSMQDIQYLGALNTYYKRYLYLNAFGITDGDVIDSLDNNSLQYTKKEVIKASPKQIEILLNYYKDDNLKKLLSTNNIDKIEELPLKKASELIEKLKGNK